MPRLRIGDIEVYHELSGSGDPVLLVHGLGSSTRDWEFQEPALTEHFRVIAYDVRGHGQTDKPPGPYSIAQFAADVDGLLQALDPGPVHLVGISMGGAIAYQLAVDAPDRVRSLTVINSGPELKMESLSERWMLFTRLSIVRLLGMGWMGRHLAKEMFPEDGQQDLRELITRRWARNDKRAYIDSIRALVGWSVAERIDAIRCPVLVVDGELDDSPINTTDEQLARMPGARRVVIPGSRHATPVDKTAEFNQVLLGFLAEV